MKFLGRYLKLNQIFYGSENIFVGESTLFFSRINAILMIFLIEDRNIDQNCETTFQNFHQYYGDSIRKIINIALKFIDIFGSI